MRVRRGARRKLNRWETEGLEALLYDDGVDRGEDLPGKTTTKMGITDLLDKLDTKYDLLRTKLFWDMIRKQSSECSCHSVCSLMHIKCVLLSAWSLD